MPLPVIGKNREFKTFVPFPLYTYRIYLIFTDDLIASANNIAKKGHLPTNHGIDDTTGGFHVRMPNQAFSYIVLKFNAKPDDIAHEAYHAIVSMFKWIGAAHEEEVFAYHLGYLVKLVSEDQKKGRDKVDKSTKVTYNGVIDEDR